MQVPHSNSVMVAFLFELSLPLSRYLSLSVCPSLSNTVRVKDIKGCIKQGMLINKQCLLDTPSQPTNPLRNQNIMDEWADRYLYKRYIMRLKLGALNPDLHFKLLIIHCTPHEHGNGSTHWHTSPAPVHSSTLSFLRAHQMTFEAINQTPSPGLGKPCRVSCWQLDTSLVAA